MSPIRLPIRSPINSAIRSAFSPRFGGSAAPAWSPALPTSGLLSEWRFSEGAGATVADSVAGARPINLDLPTTPNYTWTSRGISLASGLVQTPSVPGARTVAMLYRTGRNATSGFVLSGGSQSGAGLLQGSSTTTYSYWVSTSGAVMSPLLATSAGDLAWAINRGGWVLVIQQFDAAYTTSLGLGGRHSTTTSRCADFEIAWCGVWNRTLDASERTQVYDHVRGTFAKPRGIYIHKDDCPSKRLMVRINGQSNASGRALRSDLTAPEAARTFTKVRSAAATVSVRPTIPPGLLVLGTNQTAENASTQFGLETPLAWAWEDNRSSDLYLTKTSQGSTYLAPSSLGGGITSNTSWSTAEIHAAAPARWALRDHFDVVQSAAMSGVGLDWVWVWAQGEQDATSTTFSAVYQAELQALSDFYTLHCGAPLKRVICRIRDQDPTMNAAAAAQVRQAQADFVAANTGAVLVDTDAMALGADLVHFNAAGMRSLGAAVFAQMPGL